MVSSILNDTKKTLGIDESYKAFDLDITLHINTVFMTLQQLGVGPQEGFMIEDDGTPWIEYTKGDLNLNAVKSYIYVRVRLLFDPPTTSFGISSLQEVAKELEWRLNHHAELKGYTPTVVLPEENRIIDGGAP